MAKRRRNCFRQITKSADREMKGDGMSWIELRWRKMLGRMGLGSALLVASHLMAAKAPSGTPGGNRAHPFLFVNREEISIARARLGREPWKSLLAELKKQVEEDLRCPLPRFEREWWQSAKNRPWGEICPQIAEHTTFVPSGPIASAHRISTLYLLTGEERLAQHLLRVLRHYSTYTFEFDHYDVGMNYAGWGTPALDVYDRIFDRCTEADHRRVNAFFERMGEAIWRNDHEWLKHGWGGRHNNHYAWHRMALCALGLFFGQEEYVQHVLHGPEGVVELLDSGLMDEGLWHESSVHYHFTALHGLVAIAEMLRHARHPFDVYHRKFAGGRSLKNMFDSPLLTLFPDGTIPNVGDSYGRTAHIGELLWYEYAYSVYGDPEYAWVLSQGKRNAEAALLHGRGLKEIKEPFVASHLFREHGYAFLRAEEGRESWGGNGVVVMLNFDRNGIHCHHDHLSLILFGEKHLLAPDPEAMTSGHAFSRPVQRELNRSVICHNTIAVDGQAQQGVLREALEVAGWHLSEAEKTISVVDREGKVYPEVELNRTITLSGNRVMDTFRVSSDQPHTYEWLFHAYDEEGIVRTSLALERSSLPEKGPWRWIRNPRGACTDGDWEASWRQGDVELRLKMAAAPGTEIIACDFPQDDQFTPPPISMLVVRRKAMETTFSATYEVQTISIADCGLRIAESETRTPKWDDLHGRGIAVLPR